MAQQRVEELLIVNKRDQKLYSQFRRCPQGIKPVAVLFFHHGLGEHLQRYDRVFKRMNDAGIIVLAQDAHGHGKSEPLEAAWRAYIGSFSYMVDDFLQFIDHCLNNSAFSKELTGLPRFISGHSTGGLIAAHAALRNQDLWSGMLLHSPSLDVEWTYLTRVQAWIGRLLSYLIPAARVVTAVRIEDMSQDPAVLESYRKDPLITLGNVCARTACVILDAFNELSYTAKQLTIPVYVGHGTHDRCTSLPASKRFVKTVSSTDATLYEFQGGYHELLHGPEWQDATDRMVQWMVKRSNRA